MKGEGMVRGGFKGQYVTAINKVAEHGDGLESQSSGEEGGLCVSPNSYVLPSLQMCSSSPAYR